MNFSPVIQPSAKGDVVGLPKDSTSKPKRNGKSNGVDRDAFAGLTEQLNPNPVSTDFEVLPNGTFVELVRRGSAEGALALLVWDGEGASVVDQFEHAGRLLVPPTVDPRLSRTLRLPGYVTSCPTARELLTEICEIIRAHVDLPEESICLAASFALSSWFVDRLDVVPYLWICGPPGSGKTTLLRLLHSCCRRAVLIGGNISSAVYSLPRLLRPTILIDEVQLSGSGRAGNLEHWLRTGSTRGVPAVLGGQLVDGFGAKVLCSRQAPTDTALASRAIHLPMFPSRKTLKTVDEAAIEQVADELQNKLLMFRILHYHEFRPLCSNLSSFSPRTRDLMRSLTLPFSHDQETRVEIRRAMVEQEFDMLNERSHEPECMVIESLFTSCHSDETATVLVGEIASNINETLKHWGEESSLKPRAVGAILKSLGLRTEKLQSFGRGIRLTVPMRRRIHQLLQAYGLGAASEDRRIAECSLCAELGFIKAAPPEVLPHRPENQEK